MLKQIKRNIHYIITSSHEKIINITFIWLVTSEYIKSSHAMWKKINVALRCDQSRPSAAQSLLLPCFQHKRHYKLYCIYRHLIFCLCAIFTPPKNKQKTKQKHTHLKIAAQQVIKNVKVIMHQTPEVVLVAKFMQIRKLVLICHHNYLILNSNNTTTVQTVQLLLSYCKLMQVDLTRCCHLLADLH